ncbi:MAG: glycosyltransferase family 9 protein [Ignavibacteriae bacterium]|nr:glycosyltransferase family 9 protein [Ignavibacteriota bacterium]
MRLIKHLEYAFRHGIVYPTLRRVFRNPRHDETIDLHAVKKLLVLRYDRIGDMIVTTPLLRFLKETSPNLEVGVFASRANAAIIRHNPFVDQIFVLEKNWLALFKEMLRARRERYDVVLNFIFNRTTSAGMLANLIAPDGVKVGQGAEKYSFYFNKMLRLERDVQHMTEILAWYVGAVFGVSMPPEKLQFEIVVDEKSRSVVDSFLAERKLARRQCFGDNGREYVVFNLTATDSVRRLSEEQMVVVARSLSAREDHAVVLVSDPSEVQLRHTIAQHVRECFEFPPEDSSTLLELASLIDGAAGVITPDTSIIHFASATQTPVLGFFTSLQSPTEWLPFNVKHLIVRSKDTLPVAGISADDLTNGIDKFFHSILKR